MIFTKYEIEELLGEIDRSHIMFIGENLGIDTLSKEDFVILKKFGIDPNQFPIRNNFELMFRFGLVADALGNYKSKTIKLPEFKKFLQSGGYIPLSTAEQFSLDFIKQRAYNDIKRLNFKVKDNISQEFAGLSSRKAAEKVLTQETIKSLRNRQTVSELSSNISKKLGDWAVDFDRIADYVMHEALDQGKSQSIQKNFGKLAKVYKEVYLGACAHCQRLYLTDGISSEPKLFTLQELQSNGTNIGRKTAEWKAVIGPAHPWCRCEIRYLPPDYAWDNKSKSFKPIVKENRKRKSRAIITMS